MKIIQASQENYELVGQLVYALITELVPEQSEQISLQKMQKSAFELLGDKKNYWSFLAKRGDETLGLLNINQCTAIYAGGDFGEITELYISPPFRSQGVGEKLIKKAKEFTIQKGWEILEVGAPDIPRWERSVDFYKANGFTEIGPRLEYEV